jgi:hypothetical protein
MTSTDVTGQNDAEPARSPIRMVSIDELMPSARTQPEPSAKATTDVADKTTDVADNQRWRDIWLDFIDDPRGSVAEAADLVEADVTSLIALLSRRRDAMGQSGQAEKSSADSGTATEDLRLALRGYRDFARQIATCLKTLS